MKKRNLIVIFFIIFFVGSKIVNQQKMKEIKIKVDVPDYGKVSIINESENPIKDIKGTVREDFSYADNGFITYTFAINELAAHDTFIVPLVYVKDDVDIGRIDVWLASNRGKLHHKGTWSYAYP